MPDPLQIPKLNVTIQLVAIIVRFLRRARSPVAAGRASSRWSGFDLTPGARLAGAFEAAGDDPQLEQRVLLLDPPLHSLERGGRPSPRAVRQLEEDGLQ